MPQGLMLLFSALFGSLLNLPLTTIKAEHPAPDQRGLNSRSMLLHLGVHLRHTWCAGRGRPAANKIHRQAWIGGLHASIGGAATFDGIFLTDIVAVLLT